MELDELETGLLSLLKGEHSSMLVTFNDETGPNYETVAESDDSRPDMFNWISEEEKQKARETNRVWTVHWYPDTPVGFYTVSASTLTAAVNAALSH